MTPAWVGGCGKEDEGKKEARSADSHMHLIFLTNSLGEKLGLLLGESLGAIYRFDAAAQITVYQLTRRVEAHAQRVRRRHDYVTAQNLPQILRLVLSCAQARVIDASRTGGREREERMRG